MRVSYNYANLKFLRENNSNSNFWIVKRISLKNQACKNRENSEITIALLPNENRDAKNSTTLVSFETHKESTRGHNAIMKKAIFEWELKLSRG